MSTRTRLILVLLMLVISVATIVQALVQDGQEQVFYAITTTASHLALIGLGFWYNQGRAEKQNAWREQLRSDILGE